MDLIVGLLIGRKKRTTSALDFFFNFFFLTAKVRFCARHILANIQVEVKKELSLRGFIGM